MHAIVAPILKLARTDRHDGRQMAFYTTHLSQVLQRQRVQHKFLQMRRLAIIAECPR